VAHASWRVCDDDHTSNYHNRNSNCFSEKRLTAPGMARKHLDEVQGGESVGARGRPIPTIMSRVRPNVRQGLFRPKTRTLGRTDARTATGHQFTKEGPVASDVRTVEKHGGEGGRERRRSCRSSDFSTSLPLSLSETSVPSERPVATPTSCAATTRSLTKNDKRPAREGVRLVGGRLPQGHMFRARARGRARRRS
jgi:hypothetical protein